MTSISKDAGHVESQETLMNTLLLPAQTIDRPWLVGFAWGAMLLMSRLPQIVLQELLAVETSFAWTALGIALLLLGLSYGWRALRPLRGYLLVMALVMLITGPLDGLLRNSRLWTSWFGQERGWRISFLGERLPLLIEALLLILLLVGVGVKRQALFLAVGKLGAPAVGLRLPGIGNRWLLIGPLLALLLTLLFFFGTAAMTGTQLSALRSVLPWLPAILLFALINAFSEEVVYRAAPLSQLWQVVGERQAVWLTAVWFGLGHYSGGDLGGAVYALMAGGVALLYGKALVETRGILLPTVMHMVTDVAIYIFLALGAVGV
jgi:membrane protease YdiL (CAAX protease family)